MNVGNFAVYNPVASIPGQPQGEMLVAIDKKDTVSVARLTVGYQFNENWDLQLSYADYGTGEAKVAFPLYPGFAWAMVIGNGPDVYQRHVLRYKPTAVVLMPSYNHDVGDNLRIKVGAGVSYCSTSSHFEATYKEGAVIFPAPGFEAYSYRKETDHSLGFIASLGADYKLTNKLSAAISGNYSIFKAKVPGSPWVERSKSSVNITSFGAELALVWHW